MGMHRFIILLQKYIVIEGFSQNYSQFSGCLIDILCKPDLNKTIDGGC